MKNSSILMKVQVNFACIFLILIGTIQPNYAQSMNDEVVNDDSFLIPEVPLSGYKGVYKNGTPYSGYFKKGNNDFYTVDFYEEGIPVYQYSCDLLQRLRIEESNPHEPLDNRLSLPLKSVYRDHKIYDGFQYSVFKEGIYTMMVEKGKITEAFLDVFAMHYYNRVVLKYANDTISVSSLRNEGYELKACIQNTSRGTALYKDTKVVYEATRLPMEVNTLPVNSSIRAYRNADGVQRFAYVENSSLLNNAYQEAQDLLEFANRLQLQDVNSFQDFAAKVPQLLFEEESLSSAKAEKGIFIEFFTTNDTGAIANGIRFFEKEALYRIYKDTEVSVEQKISLEDFQEVFQNYMINEHTK